MLETIAIRTIGGKVLDAIKGVPLSVWIIAALVAAVPINGCVQYRSGVSNERAVNEAAVAKIRAERDALAVVLATEDQTIATGGQTAIEERRKVLDNATEDLPDQGLTDRQRARVCSELRRQGQRCEFLTPSATGD